MSDTYYILLICGCFFSLMLLCLAAYKYKAITLFDFSVILAWVYVFYRPFLIDVCIVNKNIYFWDKSLYVNGVILTILMVLVLQLGALFPRRLILAHFDARRNFFLEKQVSAINKMAIVISFCIVILMIGKYGVLAIFLRGSGALSVSLPCLELFFYLLVPLLSIVITVSVFYLLSTKKKFVYVSLILALIVLLIFGKRGKIISPIILSIVLYQIYVVTLNKKPILSLINVKVLVIFFLSMFILFFGSFFKSYSQGITPESKITEAVICTIQKKAKQEYDLFWPAVLQHDVDKENFYDFVTAVYGSLILPHDKRLKTEYKSATDKLMLKYNYNAYVYKKFGISPNMFQFYYFYCGYLVVPFFFLLGFVLRKIDLYAINSFFQGKIFTFFSLILLFRLLQSPIDFTVKYYVFEFLVLVIFFTSVILLRMLKVIQSIKLRES